MDAREVRGWTVDLASVEAACDRLSHQHRSPSYEGVAHVHGAAVGLPQIMVGELSEHVVLNMRPAVLHLHAGRRIEHMHPTHAVLLSRYLSRGEQCRQR